MRKGRNVVVGGQPWDRLPGLTRRRVTTEDSIFFVSENGSLLRFTVGKHTRYDKYLQSIYFLIAY
jgi:hypothetical protein